jgi:hypothetical protein
MLPEAYYDEHGSLQLRPVLPLTKCDFLARNFSSIIEPMISRNMHSSTASKIGYKFFSRRRHVRPEIPESHISLQVLSVCFKMPSGARSQLTHRAVSETFTNYLITVQSTMTCCPRHTTVMRKNFTKLFRS